MKIPIKAGFKEGTKITFEKEGDEYPNIIPGDVIFVIKEKKHGYFERQDNDLIYKHNVRLKDALLGNINFKIKTLDGRKLNVNVNKMINPGYIHHIYGEGMPISKQKGSKGNLLIHFNIVFPNELNYQQKKAIEDYF